METRADLRQAVARGVLCLVPILWFTGAGAEVMKRIASSGAPVKFNPSGPPECAELFIISESRSSEAARP